MLCKSKQESRANRTQKNRPPVLPFICKDTDTMKQGKSIGWIGMEMVLRKWMIVSSIPVSHCGEIPCLLISCLVMNCVKGTVLLTTFEHKGPVPLCYRKNTL